MYVSKFALQKTSGWFCDNNKEDPDWGAKTQGRKLSIEQHLTFLI